MTEHPVTEVFAAYLSDALPPSERAGLEAHLASCRRCRHEVTSARRLLKARSRWARWPMLVPAAAAAVLVLAILGQGALDRKGDEEIVRAGGEITEAESVSSIQVLSPAENAAVATHPIAFGWVGHPGRPLYRLTLMNETGRALYIGATTDTALVLPDSVPLVSGQSYFWYVDALDSAGRSMTTGTRRFSLAP
jgi:hypothetical protein